jgi:histidine triad (HIT) family protein
MFPRLLFRLARSDLGRLVIGWIFTYMSFVIPVKRLRETPTLVAFYHPAPAYPFHVLIVPKRSISRLIDLTAADTDFMVDVFQVTQSIIAEFALEQRGYRFISNGGKYQDVPHLHFHLIAE